MLHQSLNFRTECSNSFLYGTFLGDETTVMPSHLNSRRDSLPSASRPDYRCPSSPRWCQVRWQSLVVRLRQCLAPFARYEDNCLDWLRRLLSFGICLFFSRYIFSCPFPMNSLLNRVNFGSRGLLARFKRGLLCHVSKLPAVGRHAYFVIVMSWFFPRERNIAIYEVRVVRSSLLPEDSNLGRIFPVD